MKIFDETGAVLYRYEDHIYSGGIDEADRPIPGKTEVVLREFSVVRWTPKGVWIRTPDLPPDNEKFVLLTARKKFACPTKEEALQSFIERKKSQVRILTKQLEKAKIAQHKGEKMREEKT